MKYLILLLALTVTSCSINRIGIVHDYVIMTAFKMCNENGGLHYIVTNNEISNVFNDDKPCNNEIIFACQDGVKIKYDNGIGKCFISESQIDESLNKKD